MSRQKEQFMLLLVFLVSVLACLGCGYQREGPNRGALAGQVSLDGQPVQDGMILLIPTEGTKGPASGGVISEGKYSIPASEGPVVGKHKVEIQAYRKTGKQVELPPPASGTVDEVEQYIPSKYNATSTLTTEIKKGDNTTDFKLKK